MTSEQPAPRIPEIFFTERETLADAFLHDGRVAAYLKHHTALLDRTLIAYAEIAGVPSTCAVIAVGGYGRGEMFPFSDIDVLVLLPENHTPATDASVERFVTELWNLHLTVGSVVRTPSEMLTAAQDDISVATAFLEARYLTGDKTLFETVYADFRKNLNAGLFYRRKLLEMQQRHQHYNDSAYALEPNLKESPGGLRDLQVFLWCTKAAGWGESWRELAKNGIITETESYHLKECLHFLMALRIRLHLTAKRHEDRLVFDVQRTLALSVGCQDTDGLQASEELMKRYYLNAKNVVQLNAILIQAVADRFFTDRLAKEPVKPIDGVFCARGLLLDITDEAAFFADPHAILRTFLIYAQHRELKALSTRLLRVLWHSRYTIDAAYRNYPVNKNLFLKIMQLAHGPYHCLKNMNTWGILGRFLPVFRPIVGQMQHDLFHIYTVDQHTLLVVKYLRRFSHSSYAHEFPLCSEAMNELPGVWRMTVAGLFHDIAKGRGGNHAELGADEVLRFCRDFGIADKDADFIAFLVRHHLTMSHVAQKEDTTDPEVVKRFAAVVKTKERLDGLFALTVADIRATSPRVWNAWKQQLLEDLYRATLTVLTSNKEPTRSTVFAKHRAEAAVLVDKAGIPTFIRDQLWKELNIVYFLRHSPEDIAWHTKETAWTPNLPYPIVRARPVIGGAGIEIMIYCPDQKDLFARVVHYFGLEGLSVLDARIHTTQHGWALDTFLVRDKRERKDVDFLISRIQVKLAAVISAAKPIPEPKTGKLSRRSRNFPVPAIVNFEEDEAHKNWVLQITGNDRLGLLFAIAWVLAKNGIAIETAKISTLDERAEDVFLVASPALKDDEFLVTVESELIDAVNNAK